MGLVEEVGAQTELGRRTHLLQPTMGSGSALKLLCLLKQAGILYGWSQV